MAVDLSKLTLSVLKSELKNKGLDITGKKSELVQRLKLAFEKEAEDKLLDEEKNEDEEPMEEEELAVKLEDNSDASPETDANMKSTEDSAEKANDEATVDVNAEKEAKGEDDDDDDDGDTKQDGDGTKKPKRWMHRMASTRLTASKYKHHEVIQKMSFNRCMKELKEERREHEIFVFPLQPEDMVDPTIIDMMKKCVRSSFNLVSITNSDGEVELKGRLKLGFRKKSDALANIPTLQNFREGMEVHHSSLTQKFGDYQQKWAMATTGSPEEPINHLVLLPQLPDALDEDDMWRLFPQATEIYMRPKRKAKVMFGGEEVMRDQHAYAYVQYPTKAACHVNMHALIDVEPTEEMRQMCMVPFLLMPEWRTKDAINQNTTDKGNKKGKPIAGTKSPAAKAVEQTKKTTGFVPRDRQANFVNRTKQHWSSYGQQRNEYPSQRQMDYPQRHMGGYGRAPASVQPILNRLQSQVSMLGPAEARGVQMLGRMFSNLGTEEEYEDWDNQGGYGEWEDAGGYGQQSYRQQPLSHNRMDRKRMRDDSYGAGPSASYGGASGFEAGSGFRGGYGGGAGYNSGAGYGGEQGYANNARAYTRPRGKSGYAVPKK